MVTQSEKRACAAACGMVDVFDVVLHAGVRCDDGGSILIGVDACDFFFSLNVRVIATVAFLPVVREVKNNSYSIVFIVRVMQECIVATGKAIAIRVGKHEWLLDNCGEHGLECGEECVCSERRRCVRMQKRDGIRGVFGFFKMVFERRVRFRCEEAQEMDDALLCKNVVYIAQGMKVVIVGVDHGTILRSNSVFWW